MFSGNLPPPTNSSSTLPAPARGCPCTSANVLPGQCDQESHGCRDPRASSVLEKVVKISNEENLPSLASLEEGGEGGQVATVKVVGGPVVPRPLDGWTISTAAKFCREFLQTSTAVIACSDVPGVDVEKRMKACGEDVLVSAFAFLVNTIPYIYLVLQLVWETNLNIQNHPDHRLTHPVGNISKSILSLAEGRLYQNVRNCVEGRARRLCRQRGCSHHLSGPLSSNHWPVTLVGKKALPQKSDQFS